MHNAVMLIKFSKQIANTFAKIINSYKGEFKPCQTFETELFPRSRYWLQRPIQNVGKQLKWSFLQKLVKD